MPEQERRRGEAQRVRELKAQLNEDQLWALTELERFGWELKFIRRPPFQPAIPVVFDGDRKSYAVLLEDGTLDENPGFEIRD